MTDKKTTCILCNGSGQISYFKGVSRFLLSEEECPECGGTGFIFVDEKEKKQKAPDNKISTKNTEL